MVNYDVRMKKKKKLFLKNFQTLFLKAAANVLGKCLSLLKISSTLK